MAAAVIVVVSQCNSNLNKWSRRRKLQVTPSARAEYVYSAPDKFALQDFGDLQRGFVLSQDTTSGDLRQRRESRGDVEGVVPLASGTSNIQPLGSGRETEELEAAARQDRRRWTSVTVQLLSASDLHQGFFPTRRLPWAVISCSGDPLASVTLAATRGCFEFPSWSGSAAFRIPPLQQQGSTKLFRSASCSEPNGDQTCSSIGDDLRENGQVLPVSSDVEASLGTASGGKASRHQRSKSALEGSASFSRSSFQNFLLQHPSGSRRSNAALAKRVPRASSQGSASSPTLLIDVYTSSDLKTHLGCAEIPLSDVVGVPGVPVLGNFDLERGTSFRGRKKTEGSVRVILTARTV